MYPDGRNFDEGGVAICGDGSGGRWPSRGGGQRWSGGRMASRGSGERYYGGIEMPRTYGGTERRRMDIDY
eukprot:5765281-Karenia_brevis.AAC.1